MAAIDLRTLNYSNGGAMKKVSTGTNMQQVIIPRWCKTVTIQPKDQAIFMNYDGTDGAAPSGDSFPQPVDVIIQYNPQKTPTINQSIFFAAQAGTANVYLIFE